VVYVREAWAGALPRPEYQAGIVTVTERSSGRNDYHSGGDAVEGRGQCDRGGEMLGEAARRRLGMWGVQTVPHTQVRERLA